MKLTEVKDQFLMDTSARGRSELTIINYEQRLRSLVWLLEHVCMEGNKPIEVVELEQVTVSHLRQCIQYLLTSGDRPPSPNLKHKGRRPVSGKALDASLVGAYVRVWKSFFNWCYQEELIDVNPVWSWVVIFSSSHVRWVIVT